MSEREGLPRQLLQVLQVMFLGLQRTQITRMAAALAYRTIFGLIPVLVISLVVLRVSVSPEGVRKNIDSLLRFTGITEVTVQATEDPESVGPPMPEHLVAPVAAETNSQKIETWITEILERERNVNYRAIGIIGFLTLVYAAISMLVEVEKSFNQIYNAPEGRSWVRRVTQYWTLLTLGTVLLVASFYVQEKSIAFFNDALGRAAVLVRGESAKPVTMLAMVQRAGSFVVTSAISSLLLFVVYTVMPNTRVRWQSAVVGAVFSGVMWEAGKWGFREYVAFSAGYANLYGSIGLIPLFLLWIYVTWLIVLFGLQIAHSLQTYQVASAKGIQQSMLQSLGLLDDPRPTSHLKIVDPAAILLVISVVARRFEHGGSADATAISIETRVDEAVVAEMLEVLANAGLLNRLTQGESDGSYALSRPASAIALKDVLAAGQKLTTLEATSDPQFDELTRVRLKLVENRTLADFLKPVLPVATSPGGSPSPSVA
jgi:membrane protein